MVAMVNMAHVTTAHIRRDRTSNTASVAPITPWNKKSGPMLGIVL